MRRVVLYSLLVVAVLVAARLIYFAVVVLPEHRLQEAAAANAAADAAFKKKTAKGRALLEKSTAQIVDEARARDALAASQLKGQDGGATKKKRDAYARSYGLPPTASDVEIAKAVLLDVCSKRNCDKIIAR